MIDRNLERLKFQTSVHHKQNLRSLIDQNMIDKIEISNTPSLNYQRAYQSLYQDELQKSIMLHNKKKNLEQTKKYYDIAVSNQHQNLYKTQQLEPLKNQTSAINIPNLNYKDVDYMNYDLLKQTKALDHTLKNYDGGQKFYQNCEIHKFKQMSQKQNMRITLLKQLNQKQRLKVQQRIMKEEESKAIHNRQLMDKYNQSEMSLKVQDEKIKHKQQMLSQIQEERIKRGRRSVFSYDSYARHNPITNPIQYHIDNPYILKQIQNKSQPKNY